MKTIIITGPSCSGKTILSNKLLKLFNDSIVIKTDSYYRDNILIKFLSIFQYDIYDRLLSIKKNQINKIISSIYNKERFVLFYHYDFMRKKSYQTKLPIKYSDINQYLILEGIFAHRLDLNYQETINIVCEEEKEICYKRRIKRDQLERGRNIREVNNKFSRSWFLFYKNFQRNQKRNKFIVLNPVDKRSFDKLALNLKNIKLNN